MAHREDGEAALAYPKLDITPGEMINLWIWLEATEGRLHGEIVLVMARKACGGYGILSSADVPGGS